MSVTHLGQARLYMMCVVVITTIRFMPALAAGMVSLMSPSQLMSVVSFKKHCVPVTSDIGLGSIREGLGPATTALQWMRLLW